MIRTQAIEVSRRLIYRDDFHENVNSDVLLQIGLTHPLSLTI